MPDPLQIFIPLRKADAAQRLICGYATAELPDKAGEICDYASTKPFYEQWSADCAKAAAAGVLATCAPCTARGRRARFHRSPSTTTPGASRSPPRSSMTANALDARLEKLAAEGEAGGFFLRFWCRAEIDKIYKNQ